jgi:acetyltransferase-like isoleucine patch superfamily enzyme
MKILEIIIKFLSCFIINKNIRKKFKQKLFTFLYGYNVYTKAKYIGKELYIGGYSRVNRNTYLGDKVCLNGLQIHGRGSVKIGNYFHSGVECLIIAQNHNYEGTKIPYDETYIYKDIEIGDFVWVGSRVMILPGTKIGEGAIIQGGSVVHGEIPPYAIAGGNPAKVFKYRDIEHFKKLKLEGKFH